MGDRLVGVILVICTVMAALVVAIMLAPSVGNTAGLPHPDFPGMQIGGSANGDTGRLVHIGMYAFLFQALLLLLINCLCLLGVSRPRRDRRLYIAMMVSYLFALLVWWQMYFGLASFYETGQVSYFGGFPLPTAWQMYGTWASALPLILFYVLWFNRYIFPPEEEAAFQAILSEHRKELRLKQIGREMGSE
jgi:hypothetical protein